MTTYKLEPRFDSRKSFYGKAVVIEEAGVKQLRSYNTIVAEIREGEAEIFGTYSPTTLRHIKEFLYQNGFEVGTKAQLEEMYM
ncbi:hypothetical protein P59_260 [Bacillus phage P59]|nr:hypothetical protein P59_031 [Bacillus phage P59]QIW88857.1 hypothetical protein P59_260 [Bacillus phage P59]